MKKKELAKKIVEKEKKKAKKKARRKLHALLCRCAGGVLLLGTGYCLGIHHRVIAARIKGQPLPEAPKGHFCR